MCYLEPGGVPGGGGHLLPDDQADQGGGGALRLVLQRVRLPARLSLHRYITRQFRGQTHACVDIDTWKMET